MRYGGNLLLILLLLTGCGSRDAAAPGESESSGPSPASVAAEHGPVRVEVSVTPHPIPLAAEAELKIEVTYEAGVKVTAPTLSEDINNDFEIIADRNTLPATREGRVMEQFIYVLEPTSTGELLIAPIDVEYQDDRTDGSSQKHIVTTEALALQVAATISDKTPSLDDLSGLGEPVSLPGRPAWLSWTIVGVLMLASVVGLLWWKRKNAAANIPQLSPWEQARQELDELMASSLADQDVKEFYVALTGIVRRFLEGSKGVRAPEQTTEEFLRAIQTRADFAEGERTRLQAFLETADLVKYAGMTPQPDDIEKACMRAHEFIGETEPAVGESGESNESSPPASDKSAARRTRPLAVERRDPGAP